jgi:amidase
MVFPSWALRPRSLAMPPGGRYKMAGTTELLMTDLWRLSAVDIAALIKSKKVSAAEAAKAALARLDAVNPKLNAVIDHRPDDVVKQAAAVDAAIARGEDAGSLAGVPVTVKVNIDQEGFATTNGLKLQANAIAKSSSPVIDNLRKAGAVILGRTNCPAFSYRWFTTNLIHGDTKNPRDASLTPGGSSGGAGSAVAAGIGHIAHGTDIAGSIRYPAYACGVHGLRPTMGRVAAFNAALPERTIGPQISAVSGPLARTIADVRIALAAMSGKDVRDPWWVPAPLEGPPMPKRAALCLNPDGLDPVPEVKVALVDAGKRLARAGWTVEEISKTPPLREAADWQTKLWLGDGYEAQLEAAEKEGDPGALACLRGNRTKVFPFDQAAFSKALVRRATLAREWLTFFETYAVLVIPVSGELPFPDNLDRKDEASFARVWHAQLTQIAIPFMGLPGLTVSTGLVGKSPVGVQVVSGRYREDLCLAAGEAIEAGGVPPSPIDP